MKIRKIGIRDEFFRKIDIALLLFLKKAV